RSSTENQFTVNSCLFCGLGGISAGKRSAAGAAGVPAAHGGDIIEQIVVYRQWESIAAGRQRPTDARVGSGGCDVLVTTARCFV
ncbi:MAG: hypothetical protein ACYCZU_12495, partial [Devosia sp.]